MHTNFIEWKNPLLISDKMIEKEEFDEWISFFRAAESDFDARLDPLNLSQAELDAYVFEFEKSSAVDFKNKFDIRIEIRKLIRHIGGRKFICPSLIVMPIR